MLAGFTAALGPLVGVSIPVIAESSSGAGTQSCSVFFNRDGTVTNESAVSLGDWISPKNATVGDGYEVVGTLTSGTALDVSPGNGVYAEMTANVEFSMIDSTVGGSKAWTGTFAIRPTSGGADLATRTSCTITANRTS